jgi:fructan beta-fructosidase
MTIPRVLELKNTAQGIRLVQTPIRELQALRNEKVSIQNEEVVPGKNLLENVQSNTFEIIAEFEIGSAAEFGFKVCKGVAEETIIGYDVENNKLFVDRTNSGEANFHETFAEKHGSHLISQGNKITLHVFVDQSSVELFGNDGVLVMTDLIFPNQENKQIELYAKNGEVKLHSLELYTLKTIW